MQSEFLLCRGTKIIINGIATLSVFFDFLQLTEYSFSSEPAHVESPLLGIAAFRAHKTTLKPITRWRCAESHHTTKVVGVILPAISNADQHCRSGWGRKAVAAFWCTWRHICIEVAASKATYRSTFERSTRKLNHNILLFGSLTKDEALLRQGMARPKQDYS